MSDIMKKSIETVLRAIYYQLTGVHTIVKIFKKILFNTVLILVAYITKEYPKSIELM
jgi:hypothetical protein